MKLLPASVTRRDFLNGVALGIGGAPFLSLAGCTRGDASYPPALTGMRGAHAGSFEVAHALAMQDANWLRPNTQTDSDYDLIIIGAGVSGLSAAHFYRARAGADAGILILDNHDDFGGHAKRNEFSIGGKTLIGYGGSQSLDNPSAFSDPAKALLAEIGVETERFYRYFARDYYQSRGMGSAIFYDAAHYGENRLTDIPFEWWSSAPDRTAADSAIETAPLDSDAKKSLRALVFSNRDHLAGLSQTEKIDRLRRISYEAFLLEHAGVADSVATLLRRTITGLWGVGWDCLSALEAVRIGMPGTGALAIAGAIPRPYDHDEPYIFHFPDGNASIARLLVRALIPASANGDSMEDMVRARMRYDVLDRPDQPVRIRLSSTVVGIENAGDGVDVTYVCNGEAARVRATNAIFAGYLHMLPYVCTELSEEQRVAIEVPEKIPLVYVNVALRNWRAFESAGYSRFYAPQAFFESASLDFPVSMGGYEFAQSPDDPVILHLQHVPIAPGEGLNERQQHRAGRQRLLTLTFEDFEHAITEQLGGMLGPHGFDAARDIAAVTVNRWPHGYAYEYNELYDPWDWTPENGPHVVARAPVGRIAIAGSDSNAYAYVNGAIDAAHRAVSDIMR